MKKLCLLFLVLSLLLICSCGKTVHYNEEDYLLNLEYKDDFRILQVTDIHLGNKDVQEEHLEVVKKTIDQANADLIIVSGDTFTFADKRTVKKVCNFFDSFEIPWTIIFGNHDEQCYFSIDWLTNYFNTKCKNIKFIDYQDDDVDGNSNFVINLNQDNQIFEQIYLLDSNRYYFGEFNGYDCIHENQIEWYERMVNYTTSKNNNTVVPSLMYIHIPLCEYVEGFENGELISGEKIEDSTCSKINSGMFDKILELGSTKAVYCGHDHLNNFNVSYKGINLIYGINSTNRIYYREDCVGGKVTVLHNDHSLTWEDIYVTYDEVE